MKILQSLLLTVFLLMGASSKATQANSPDQNLDQASQLIADDILNNLNDQGLLKDMSNLDILAMGDAALFISSTFLKDMANNDLNLFDANSDLFSFSDIGKWIKGAAKDAFKWTKQAVLDVAKFTKKHGPGFLKALKDVVIIIGPIAAPILDVVASAYGVPPGTVTLALNGVVGALRLSKEQKTLLTKSPDSLSPEEKEEQAALVEKLQGITATVVGSLTAAKKGINEKKAADKEEQENKKPEKEAKDEEEVAE